MALKHRDYTPEARSPLEGVRVLDLSRLVAGNTLTQVLADFGADVIKIEPPTGDTLRAWRTKDVQANWKIYSRNKKSLALDLRSPESSKLLLELVPSAAMLIESFRPGTLERWNLTFERLQSLSPKLNLVRVSGFGQTGPYADRPGYDLIAQAMSGVMSITGTSDGTMRCACEPTSLLI